MSSESSQKEGYKIHRLKDLINRNLIRFDKSAQNNAEESDSLKPQPLTVRLALYFSDLMSVINDFGVSGPKAYLDITGINDEIAFTTRRQGLVGAIEIQGQIGHDRHLRAPLANFNVASRYSLGLCVYGRRKTAR